MEDRECRLENECNLGAGHKISFPLQDPGSAVTGGGVVPQISVILDSTGLHV
jgi:hypothetical protein